MRCPNYTDMLVRLDGARTLELCATCEQTAREQGALTQLAGRIPVTRCAGQVPDVTGAAKPDYRTIPTTTTVEGR